MRSLLPLAAPLAGAFATAAWWWVAPAAEGGNAGRGAVASVAVAEWAVALPPATPGASASGPSVASLDGRDLAAELGCGGCHGGLPGPDAARAGAPDLGPGGPPLAPDFVFAYLADPVRRREDIGRTRMPDFRLDEGERVALALYLGTSGDEPGTDLAAARRRHPDADARLGGRIFRALGCAGCHRHADATPTRVGPDLAREGARVREAWLREWLADPAPIRTPAHPAAPGSRMPDFRLSGDELEALVEYLSGLGAPVRGPAPPALTPHEERRAERFLEERVACLGCHRIEGGGGGIGPSLEGVAGRLEPAFVLEAIRDPASALGSDAMPRQRMPAVEARRLARLLLDRSGPWRPAERPSLADPEHPAWAILQAADTAGPAPDGAALYARHCVACHGREGRGDGWNAAALPVPPTVHADAEAMGRRPDDTLYDGIHAGAYVLDGSPRMPPFGETLRPGEIRALVAHIRTLCRCRQPAWAGGGGQG